MKKPSVSILAIGNELVFGKIVDTNSAFLASKLYEAGFQIHRICLVSDSLDDICSELSRVLSFTDFIITTGGLGPTSDDLTREALAKLTNTPLVENTAARKKLEELLTSRKRPINENNLRQIYFPEGAEVIENRAGTADAFITRLEQSTGKKNCILSLPGVPRELKIIFEEKIQPWLNETYLKATQKPQAFHLKCFGYSESHLGQVVESCALPTDIEVAYRPMFPEILLSFTHRGKINAEKQMQQLHEIKKKVSREIGEEFVISENPTDTLPAVLGRILQERSLKLSAGESCSGGRLADAIIASPGASAYFLSSVVAYQNDAKSVFLGVRPAVIERYGAVSKEVAIEMARGALYKMGADISVSITGIAGPDGGSLEKPAGTFWVGLVTRESEEAFHQFYPVDRDLFRQYSAYLALDLVRRKILGFPLTWERR